jgi:hypothetical protein
MNIFTLLSGILMVAWIFLKKKPPRETGILLPLQLKTSKDRKHAQTRRSGLSCGLLTRSPSSCEDGLFPSRHSHYESYVDRFAEKNYRLPAR